MGSHIWSIFTTINKKIRLSLNWVKLEFVQRQLRTSHLASIVISNDIPNLHEKFKTKLELNILITPKKSYLAINCQIQRKD